MKRFTTIFLLILVSSIQLYGQAVAGSGAISGTVRDTTGAVIPGATAIVTNELKGIKRTMTSTEAGVFTAPALVPAGGYTLTVTLPGFKTWEAKNVEIQVGQPGDFRVVVEVSGATTGVGVTGE